MCRVPRIAVLLPVYNGEAFLAEAVHSVLCQTFPDFELLVIDDGSTDGTPQVLAGFSDARLRVIRFLQNSGIVAALNRGIEESRSELIARMDADDVCLPRRLERQVKFLDAHPEIKLCGTWTRQFGDESIARRPPQEPEEIRARLFFGWAMDPPSIMFQRSFIERHGLRYDAAYRHVEDYDFFLRAADCGHLANLPEILLRTRAHSGEISILHEGEQIVTEGRLLRRELLKLVPECSEEDQRFHLRMLNEMIGAAEFPQVSSWLARLERANHARLRFDRAAFRRELRRQRRRYHPLLCAARRCVHRVRTSAERLRQANR